MPKYFFDLNDRTGCLNRTGGFFNSDQAAKQEALLRAFKRQMLFKLLAEELQKHTRV